MNVESPRVSQLWNLPQPVTKKPLTILPLVALIFYDVSGGPFGVEDAVSAGGPLLTILGFVLLPLAWSVPEALITSELATAFPENSGFVAWVTAAFGPWWGFQEGFWKWLSGVTDNAVYPVIFLTYLQQVLPILESGFLRVYVVGYSIIPSSSISSASSSSSWCIVVLMPCSFFPCRVVLVLVNLGLTYMNYRGLHVVGNAAIGMTIFTLLPFVIMCFAGVPHVDPGNWLSFDFDTIKWIPFLNVMFWYVVW